MGRTTGVEPNLRDVDHVLVMEHDAHYGSVDLEVFPSGHAVAAAVTILVDAAAKKPASRHIAAQRIHVILAHEGRVAGQGAILLAEIDEGRNGVLALARCVFQHEVVRGIY